VLDDNVPIFNSLFQDTQFKKDQCDLQSLAKVLYHQKPCFNQSNKHTNLYQDKEDYEWAFGEGLSQAATL